MATGVLTHSTVVGGTHVTLIGTLHDEFCERAAVSEALSESDPDALYIELEPEQSLEWYANDHDDATALYEYVEEHNPEVVKYDTPWGTPYVERVEEMSEEEQESMADDISEEILIGTASTASDSHAVRESFAKHTPDWFDDAFTQREDSAATSFVEGVYGNDNDRICIQCGLAHFVAYRSLLRFLTPTVVRDEFQFEES